MIAFFVYPIRFKTPLLRNQDSGLIAQYRGDSILPSRVLRHKSRYKSILPVSGKLCCLLLLKHF